MTVVDRVAILVLVVLCRGICMLARLLSGCSVVIWESGRIASLGCRSGRVCGANRSLLGGKIGMATSREHLAC